MKQKNLILVIVAVACGTVAAVLVASQLNAKTAKPKVEETVEIPVAARDIAIGTRITAKDVEKFFTKKKFPKDALPPAFVADTQELVDKRTMRPIRLGETINPLDISTTGFIAPPDGHVLMTAPISLERGASGFALPGTRVMVIASKKSQKKNVEFVFPLFLDTLILAVDTNSSAPPANQNGQGTPSGQQTGSGATAAGFHQMSMISFAVTPEDSILLSMAAEGATLRIALPVQDEEKKEVIIDGYKTLVPSREEIRRIFSDDWSHEEKKVEQTPPMIETVKVLVPKENIEEGAEITEEFLDRKFKEVDFPKEFLNSAAATVSKDLLGQFTTADLVANMLAPKAHLAKTKKLKMNPVVPTGEFAAAKTSVTESDVTFPKAETDSTPVPEKKVYTYVKVVTAQGTVVHKYEVLPEGNKYVGVVTPGLNND